MELGEEYFFVMDIRDCGGDDFSGRKFVQESRVFIWEKIVLFGIPEEVTVIVCHEPPLIDLQADL